ncbi:hypothetical protein GCM10027431_05560 [Lysobacter rhizosphaerae]
MPLGNGDTVPSTYITCPLRDTFHMPGPGNLPDTMTGASSRIGGAACDAPSCVAKAGVTHNDVNNRQAKAVERIHCTP